MPSRLTASFEAFGVRFASEFALPELDGAPDARDPGCTLRLVAPTAPAERFSGPCEPAAVSVSALGDGRTSRIERGVGGDYLLSYGEGDGDGAVLWLAADGGELDCGAPDPEDPAWRRWLLDTGLGFVGLASGHEALHAAAVLTPAGVVAVAAGQGGGKSTLLVELVGRGLPLFTDDLLMLGPELASAAPVEAHPGPPLVNLPPRLADGRSATSVGRVLAELDGELWLAVDRPPVAAAPVAAIALLERGRFDRLSVTRPPASPLALLSHSLQGGSDRRRARARFEACASLAATAAVLRVEAPLDAPAAGVADALLGELGRSG